MPKYEYELKGREIYDKNVGDFHAQRNSVTDRAKNIVQTVYDFLKISETETIITFCFKFAFGDPGFSFPEFPPILTRTRSKLTEL